MQGRQVSDVFGDTETLVWSILICIDTKLIAWISELFLANGDVDNTLGLTQRKTMSTIQDCDSG